MLAYFLVCFWLVIINVYGFNVDTRTATIYAHPNRTYLFGFTVALHSYQSTRWLLVGAPLTDVISPNGRLLHKYGGIFKCETAGSNACVIVNVDNEPERKELFPAGSKRMVAMETKSGQWLGATLKTNNKTVLVCAPRYSHKKEDRYKTHEFIDGLNLRPWLSGGCYRLHGNLSRQQHGGILKPWAESKSYYTGNSEAGFSAALLDTGVVMGTVGISFPPNQKEPFLGWTGGLNVYSMTSHAYKTTSRDQLGKNDYMGYDVAIGYYGNTTRQDIAGGAPRGNNMKGKVLIYDIQEKTDIVFKSQLKLPKEEVKEGVKEQKTPFGTYFGSTLCAVDLNQDGMTDLLVGAPFYTDTMDEGRVYVYVNKKGIPMLSDVVLKGDNLRGARFGTAIANVGDLNRDGYQDVAIGAPFEGHNSSGAVYIYYGTKTGIESEYRQKILSRTLNENLLGFGYSISGKVDVDGNGYPDIAVGSFLSGHAVLFRTRRIVEVQALIRPDRNRIVLENNKFMCHGVDGTLYKCLNVTVCFRFKDREPSNRRDLEISFDMEADADIIILEYRRMYFYNGKDKTFTIEGRTTIPTQENEHCLNPYTVYITRNIRFLDLLKKLTFDLKFSLADKACESVPNIPCAMLDEYLPTAVRNDEVVFQKHCSHEVCKPDLSVTAHVQLPGNHTVLVVGTEDVLTVHMNIENNAKDASYQSIVSLYFPDNLSYIGPTSTKNVLCSSYYGNETTLATCQIGNPFKPQTKKSLSIKFTAHDVTDDFVISALVSSASNDTNQANNMVSIPITTKYLTDMELTGVSQPHDVIYTGNPVSKNVTGPVIIQTLTIRNHGPSFVEGAIANIQVPKLYENNPDSTVLYIDEVEVSQGPGKCYEMLNGIVPEKTNLSQPALSQTMLQNKLTTILKTTCRSAECYLLECKLGRLAMDEIVHISMKLRLNQNTLIKNNKANTKLVTTAQLSVPTDIMQTDTSNDNVKIILTARPSSEAKNREDVSWWIILVSILGGLILLAVLIAILYKCGFFKRSRPDKQDALPEKTTPMKV